MHFFKCYKQKTNYKSHKSNIHVLTRTRSPKIGPPSFYFTDNVETFLRYHCSWIKRKTIYFVNFIHLSYLTNFLY